MYTAFQLVALKEGSRHYEFLGAKMLSEIMTNPDLEMSITSGFRWKSIDLEMLFDFKTLMKLEPKSDFDYNWKKSLNDFSLPDKITLGKMTLEEFCWGLTLNTFVWCNLKSYPLNDLSSKQVRYFMVYGLILRLKYWMVTKFEINLKMAFELMQKMVKYEKDIDFSADEGKERLDNVFFLMNFVTNKLNFVFHQLSSC